MVHRLGFRHGQLVYHDDVDVDNDVDDGKDQAARDKGERLDCSTAIGADDPLSDEDGDQESAPASSRQQQRDSGGSGSGSGSGSGGVDGQDELFSLTADFDDDDLLFLVRHVVPVSKALVWRPHSWMCLPRGLHHRIGLRRHLTLPQLHSRQPRSCAADASRVGAVRKSKSTAKPLPTSTTSSLPRKQRTLCVSLV